MKKVLIVTYFFPPVNAVAGHRAWSWAKYFHEYGIYPTVVTRHWSGMESKWSDLTDDTNQVISYQKMEGYDIYKLPSRKIKFIEKWKKSLLSVPLISKTFYFMINLLGHFNVEADARSSFSDFLFNHLKENNYDVLIVTSPPLNLIRLASEINQKTGIPVHIDFRDLWNNGYLNASYTPAVNLRIIDFFKERYIGKWLRDASGISAVSEPIAGIINELREVKNNIFVMTNGYDDSIFAGIEKQKSSKFRFSLVGSYYIQQDFNLLINGLREFLKDKSPDEFVVNLIGLSVHDEVATHLLNELPCKFVMASDRVNAEDAAAFIVNSEVLFQSGWQGYRGVYTTKLFDFIASGSRVLVAPGDDDVIDELVERLQAGAVVNSVAEFVSVLNNWFYEWKSTGILSSSLDKEAVKKYSRKYNAELFADVIKSVY